MSRFKSHQARGQAKLPFGEPVALRVPAQTERADELTRKFQTTLQGVVSQLKEIGESRVPPPTSARSTSPHEYKQDVFEALASKLEALPEHCGRLSFDNSQEIYTLARSAMLPSAWSARGSGVEEAATTVRSGLRLILALSRFVDEPNPVPALKHSTRGIFSEFHDFVRPAHGSRVVGSFDRYLDGSVTLQRITPATKYLLEKQLEKVCPARAQSLRK